MNRNDLIARVANQTDLTKTQVNDVLDATLKTVIETVKSGDSVQLVGFGSFSATDRKEQEGRNPRTGETITIPARKLPKFTAGKGFKETLNAA